MIFRHRPLVRLGAAALLAAGAFTAFGAPAHAAGTETDLALDVVGTKVADGVNGKVAFARVTNKGENTPSELAVRVDVSKLDWSKVVVDPGPACEPEGQATPPAFLCHAPKDELPGPGETFELPLILLKPDGPLAAPYSVPVGFEIVSKDDTNKENNTKSVNVEFTKESGADLYVTADDVKNAVKVKNGDEIEFAGDLHAGDTAALIYDVWNQGDLATAGFKVTVKLPEGVTFTETEDDCEYAAGKGSLVCTYPELPFVPWSQVGGGDDGVPGGVFCHLLSVGADVKAGALTGGTVSVEPILPAKGVEITSFKIKNKPANMTLLKKADLDGDLDPSDNTDGFAVIVAADGGAGGGLPVTGAKAGLIGGIGVAVLAVGGALFLIARRRRVVLVTPADEKSTD
ncbi:hypothetical protein AB0C02_01935 [Micromonospora sp. NPDC048999]|uniref:hypothetical protein n=1 Tax=Micromonospora sp. NPDC048999 TaxID=3155391 RepID=UPI0033FB0111